MLIIKNKQMIKMNLKAILTKTKLIVNVNYKKKQMNKMNLKPS